MRLSAQYQQTLRLMTKATFAKLQVPVTAASGEASKPGNIGLHAWKVDYSSRGRSGSA